MVPEPCMLLDRLALQCPSSVLATPPPSATRSSGLLFMCSLLLPSVLERAQDSELIPVLGSQSSLFCTHSCVSSLIRQLLLHVPSAT